jgi:hypothetical protein
MEKKRSLRTTDLVATFENGFAKDWFYAVGDFFRDHLDIFLTDRVVKEINIDGKEYKRVKKVWTQGDLFTFDEGHLFYNSSKKYMVWEEALTNITVVCQVAMATPDLAGVDGGRIDGRVSFDLWRADKSVSGLDHIGRYDKTQHEFVEYLKTGEL